VLHSSGDPTLATINTEMADERFTMFVDFRNPRFWKVHTMGGSNASDWFVGRLISIGPDLDRAWLPAELLESISRLGFFRGLGLDFDLRPFLGDDEDDDQAPVTTLKMQLWGNKAARVLDVLRAEGAFPGQTTLSKVKVKYRLSDESPDLFTIDDVKFDGKVTARGTSFQSHSDLLSTVQESYAAIVRATEAVALTWSADTEGAALTGEPLYLRFSSPIRDIEGFCAAVFSAGDPFRLWGVPREIASRYYRVHAVDLHVGNTLTVEATPDFLRLYLPHGSCGNTVLRLYTNLQHHFDSQVRAERVTGERLFGL